MGNETLPLWEDEPVASSQAREPASWVKRHGHQGGYSGGCRCNPCTEAWREYNQLLRQGLRRCQYCQGTYAKKTGGGSKFCNSCASEAYGRNQPRAKHEEATCARCGATYRKRAIARWQLCSGCTSHPVFRQVMSSLAKHRAPIDLVLQVIDNPQCANTGCGAPLLGKVRAHKSSGWGTRVRGNFTVDHDHACCPGDTSCGRCIRGVLCRKCNAMLTTDQPQVLRGLADYLDRYQR